MIALVVLLVAVVVHTKINEGKRRALAAKVGASGSGTFGGRYATGHPALTTPCDVWIMETPTDFLLSSDDGRQLATIPRGAITSLEVLDKTKVEMETRYTLTRVALLGIFALAAPKRTRKVEQTYLLSVEWRSGGIACTTYSRFDGAPGQQLANAALSCLAQGRTAA